MFFWLSHHIWDVPVFCDCGKKPALSPIQLSHLVYLKPFFEGDWLFSSLTISSSISNGSWSLVASRILSLDVVFVVWSFCPTVSHFTWLKLDIAHGPLMVYFSVHPQNLSLWEKENKKRSNGFFRCSERRVLNMFQLLLCWRNVSTTGQDPCTLRIDFMWSG